MLACVAAQGRGTPQPEVLWGGPVKTSSQCGSARERVSRSISAALGLALLLAAAQPARAEPINLRLREPSAEASRPPLFARSAWPKSSDIVVGSTQSRGPLSLVLLGAGVVAAGAAVYFGEKSLSAASDWRAAPTTETRADARDRTRGAATKANIGWVAAGALVATGAGVLFFTDL